MEKKQAYIKAQELERAFQADSSARQAAAVANITFVDAFPPWLKLYKSPPSTKPTTYGSYVDIYHAHLEPF